MVRAGSLALAALAYLLLSAGLVLMKKGIGWIGFQGPRDRDYSRHLVIWVSGFLLSNAYIVPATVALRALSPHVVGSFAGLGVAAMMALSAVLLGEKFFLSDAMGTGLVAASIVLLNVFEKTETEALFRSLPMAAMSFLPLLLLFPACLKFLSHRVRAFSLALLSGTAAGMIVVTMKVLVRMHGFRVSRYFYSPYGYLYILFSLTAFLALQVAYKKGDMMRVGIVYYAAAIAYPFLGSFLVFGIPLHPLQVFALGGILAGVAGILRRH